MERRSFLALLGLAPFATVAVAEPMLQDGTVITDMISPPTRYWTAPDFDPAREHINHSALMIEDGSPVLVSYVNARPVQKMQWLR